MCIGIYIYIYIYICMNPAFRAALQAAPPTGSSANSSQPQFGRGDDMVGYIQLYIYIQREREREKDL